MWLSKDMVDGLAHTSVPGENAFVGRFPNSQQIEEHMRRTLGIRRRAS